MVEVLAFFRPFFNFAVRCVYVLADRRDGSEDRSCDEGCVAPWLVERARSINDLTSLAFFCVYVWVATLKRISLFDFQNQCQLFVVRTSFLAA